MNNLTGRLRVWWSALLSLVVLAGVAGWLIGRDPTGLGGILGTMAAAAAIGEASNVGKRATFKPEAK